MSHSVQRRSTPTTRLRSRTTTSIPRGSHSTETHLRTDSLLSQSHRLYIPVLPTGEQPLSNEDSSAAAAALASLEFRRRYRRVHLLHVDSRRTTEFADRYTQVRTHSADKWRHFLAYGVLAGAILYATVDRQVSVLGSVSLVVGLAFVYGVGIEFGQSLIPNRYFSLLDAYANFLGTLLVTPWYLVRRHVEFAEVRTWISEFRVTTDTQQE
ncbi:VanZ family protein [Halomicroarcula sp. GCM10025710]